MVRRLWDEAIEKPQRWASIHKRAEALLEQVNTENPVVNWGLTDLHAATRSSNSTADSLVQRRSSWLEEIERYDRDPNLWMRRYYQKMIEEQTRAHGSKRGQAFAEKLVPGGRPHKTDVPPEAQR